MIIELHLLQSFPVSNLNRDDVGQPKTATFGGTQRARISSQSIKRAARLLLQEHGLASGETGLRTKRLVATTADLLVNRGRSEEESVAVAGAALSAIGLSLDGKKQQPLTKVLLFVGKSAAELLADYCERDWDRLAADAARAKNAKDSKDSKDSKDGKDGKGSKAKPDRKTLAEAARIFDASRVVDVALFGRMIAENKDFNVDAASQVAHALSTHAVATDYDYYTAVDDLNQEDTGADMIGTVDFNAACYYRYANLNLDQLASNLAGDVDLIERASAAWLNAFIDAIPSGKQNSMAALTPPETLLVVVRDRGAWNLANAFLRPVKDDLMASSTRAMLDHLGKLRGFYGEGNLRAVIAASVTQDLSGLSAGKVAQTRDELVAMTVAATAKV